MRKITLSNQFKKLSKLRRINIGCGETKLSGFINIDIEKRVNPDLVWDVTKRELPIRPNSILQINCIHNLEHIKFEKWETVLQEFYRVLQFNGKLILAYPEFEICTKFFLSNYKNQKDFWRQTLYGRQLYRGDYHIVPMVTKDIIKILGDIGFDNFKYKPEVEQEFNTFLVCQKKKLVTREDVIRKEVFGKK